MVSVYDLDSSSVVDATQKLMLSGTRLFTEYLNIYVNAYSKLNLTGYFDKVYEDWLKICDGEFDEHLRTEQFISTLNEYVESCIELHAAMERVGYPVSLINDLIDEYLRASMILSNVPVKPYSTSHDVIYKKMICAFCIMIHLQSIRLQF